MGRIKTTLIKRITLKLFKDHKDKFKSDFEHNKQVVDELLITSSRKQRNVIAGYATRLSKQEKK